MTCRIPSKSVRCLLLLFPLLLTMSCGRDQDGAAGAGPGDRPSAQKTVRRDPPADLAARKAGSIQILDGPNADMRGMAGMGASMDPGQTLPELPCLWVIRSLGDDDAAVARSLGVSAGNVYYQPREGRGTTSYGRLPVGGTLWLLRSFDPALTDDEIFAQFDTVMTWEPWTQIDYATTTEGLIDMLGSEDLQARLGARHRLLELADPRTPDLLIAALGGRGSEVRQGVIGTMKERPDPRYVEPLVGALRDADWEVRYEATDALRKTKDPRLVEPLIAMLEDSVGLIRWTAIDGLVELGDPRIFEPIVRALGDPDHYVRGAAAGALGRLGDPRGVEPLIAALGDSLPEFVASVAFELGRLGDRRAIAPLEALQDHPDWHVRDRASEAIAKIKAARQ